MRRCCERELTNRALESSAIDDAETVTEGSAEMSLRGRRVLERSIVPDVSGIPGVLCYCIPANRLSGGGVCGEGGRKPSSSRSYLARTDSLHSRCDADLALTAN